MRARVRLGIAIAVLAAVQAATWLIYRVVEDRKTVSSRKATFSYEPASGPAPGREIPLKSADGALTRLRDYEQDAVVLHFWATWCAPCRTELPMLLELAREPPRPRIRFLFVSVDESWATVRHFFEDQIPTGILRDETGELKQAYSVGTLPETYLLRQGAILRGRVRGARDWSSSEAQESLRQLLAQP